MLLERIASPADVKALRDDQIPALCQEIRRAILTSSSVVGGHIGSNLGAVELIVAMHRVFDSPRDKFIFDVSHQTYTHKMLTGRAASYLDPERFGELSGFSNPLESEHDLFSMGHTSTSVSLACGMARARDLLGQSFDVVAVIGDGSLSGGLALEGLSNLAELGSGAIVVVNDNCWSIAENHGGIYRSLADLRATGGTSANNIFTALGLDYRYLEQGNDESAIEDALGELRGIDHPIVLHLHTNKGEGYAPAESDAEGWHHVGPFELDECASETESADNARGGAHISADAAAESDSLESRSASGTSDGALSAEDPAPKSSLSEAHLEDPSAVPGSYAEVTGSFLMDRMTEDPSVVAVSAATPYIMGLTPARRRAAGRQFIDVGIAEEHAVTCATGLARAGAKPVVGIYGVFMQRAYDQLWHDVCLNAAHVTILDFGSSVFGTADATHLGFFDLALMSALPNLTCLAPACVEEYRAMLRWALDDAKGPVIIRVPGTAPASRPDLAADLPAHPDFSIASYQTVREGSQVAVLALGDFFPLGERVCESLGERGVEPTLINPRFATDFDLATLHDLTRRHRCIVTLEDGVLEGGWGEKIARILGSEGTSVLCYGIRKSFPDRYDVEELLAENGMTVEGITRDALASLG